MKRCGGAARRRATALGLALPLAACGGSGGGVATSPAPPVSTAPVVTPTPAPVVTPAPTPVVTPSPTPTTAAVNYDTAEYRASVGAVSMNALAAYRVGATGAGIGIAIIDSGIDLQSDQFTGRLSAASQDVAGNTSVDDQSGHGTAVAFAAAGGRNAMGSHGVAFDATVIALRADRPGSCTTSSTTDTDAACKFPTDAITRGVDAARVAGARVVNLSLGGSEMPQSLVAAIGRATAAGMVLVIAAGNDGTAQPDAFASVASTPAAAGQVIIAGSVGSGDTISSFSDRAGTQSSYFLTAVGERVRAQDENNVSYLWSGTSFAAPQISGAVALLAQAFPKLTGAQIVNLLYLTARDAGAAGVDPVYGRGVLDLTRAFQPVGTSALAGSTAAVSTLGNGTLSAPMGDAEMGSLGAVILDGFDRAFAIDLAQTLSHAAPQPVLAPALTQSGRAVALGVGGTRVAMTLSATAAGGVSLDRTRLSRGDAAAARAIAGSVTQRLGAKSMLAFGFSQGAGTLQAQLSGTAEPAFLVAQSGSLGFGSAPASSVAFRQQVGRLGVSGSAESGDVYSATDPLLAGRNRWTRRPYTRAAVTLDRRFGALATSLGGTRLAERDTVLGATLGAGLGAPRATSWFAEGAVRWTPGDGWTLGGSWRRGWTAIATGGGVAGQGRLRLSAFAADIGRDGVLGGGMGLRVAQPLRVASGGLDLALPTGWDDAAGRVTGFTPQRLNLAPTGREVDVEWRYWRPLGAGLLQANLYLRRDPDNRAGVGADHGLALRYALGF